MMRTMTVDVMTHDDDDTKMLLLRLLLIDDDQDFSFFVWSHLRAQASTKAGLTNYKNEKTMNTVNCLIRYPNLTSKSFARPLGR